MMRFFKEILWIMIVFIFISCQFKPEARSPQGQVTELNFPKVMEEAHRLPARGKLRKDSNGYVYIKIDERFVSQVYEKLYMELSAEERKCLLMSSNIVGAHITVANVDSIWLRKLKNVKTAYSFSPSKLKKITFKIPKEKSNKDYDIEVVWYYISIDSSQIQALSETLRSQTTPDDIGLHISIARSVSISGESNCVDE